MTLLGDGCYMFLEEGICNPIYFMKMAKIQQQNITLKKLQFVLKAKKYNKRESMKARQFKTLWC